MSYGKRFSLLTPNEVLAILKTRKEDSMTQDKQKKEQAREDAVESTR